MGNFEKWKNGWLDVYEKKFINDGDDILTKPLSKIVLNGEVVWEETEEDRKKIIKQFDYIKLLIKERKEN